MNTSINSLLGPLEAATRSGSWEDVEDIAGEIRRLAKLQRLSELQKIQEALGYRIKQGLSTRIPPANPCLEPWRRLDFMDAPKTPLGPSWSEPWPFG